MTPYGLGLKLRGRHGWLTIVLVFAFLWSLLSVPWGEPLLHPGGGKLLWQFISAIVKPDLSPQILSLAVISTWRTLAYALAGMTVAVILAFPLGILASGALSQRHWLLWVTVGCTRSFLSFLRAVHELVWAWLFVAAIGLSPLAAVLALGLAYGGVLGRIYADLLNDVPQEPLRALRTTGAGRVSVFFYGVLPMALPDMLSYTFYRFECAIRSAAILSFVGLGGLGYQIQISLDDLHYDQVWTFLFFLVGIVVLVDMWSSEIRRRWFG